MSFFVAAEDLHPFGKDYRDGAGGPVADAAALWCNPTEGDITVGGGPITLTSDGGTTFTPPGEDLEHYNVTGDPSGPPIPFSYDTSNLYTAYEAEFTLLANTRFRVVVAWDKCVPTSGSGPGTGPYSFTNPTEDFDVFLCPSSGGDCIGQSRSVYDNKEGFDVTITEADTYVLSVVYDANASIGCNGSNDVDSAWAYAYGDPSEFQEAP